MIATYIYIHTHTHNQHPSTNHVKYVIKDLKREIDNNTIIVGYFNTSLSAIVGSSNYWIAVVAPHFRTNELSRHIQNTPSNSSQLHVLFMRTWNILQDTSYDRPKKKKKQS